MSDRLADDLHALRDALDFVGRMAGYPIPDELDASGVPARS